MTLATLILSILAILISLGSAIFARRSAKAAERSANEAMKSRRDVLGPSVSITNERALLERWYWDPIHHENNPQMGAPSGIKPANVLLWPGNKGVRILLGAHIILTNEGSLTTTVSINALRSDRCDNYDDYKEVTASPPAPSTIATPDAVLLNGKLSLAPGETAGVIVRHGPSLEEWRNNGGDRPIVVEISAETSPDGARQSWKMTLASPLLERDRLNDSTYRVAMFQLPEIELIELPREYPSSVRRSKKD